ncbi:MAG: hypothetical protein MI674_01155 [Cytophagales bacterium]|nr:hypothetical protein [Cytophagales bacterium]
MIEEDKLTFQPLSFKQVYVAEDPPVVLDDGVGWGANKQLGDFTQLRISGTKEDIQKFDSYGVWNKVDEHIKLPVISPKIKKHLYYIVLDAGEEASILVLCGRNYDGSGPNSLTLLRIGKTRVAPMCDQPLNLHEIIETERGYRLGGTIVPEIGEKQRDGTVVRQDEHKCELLTEHGELSIEEF